MRWESSGEGDYTLETTDAPRGTHIVLHLREGEDELLDEWRLRQIIRKYSDHITLPIEMPTAAVTDEDGRKPSRPAGETVNKASAPVGARQERNHRRRIQGVLPARRPRLQRPAGLTHARVEGRQEYTQLFLPAARAPFDLYDRDARHGVKLYVRRVFIMDDADKLMPQYLRFVRGVIDLADLPLNVSRELLQGNKDIDAIRAGCVKKCCAMLKTWRKPGRQVRHLLERIRPGAERRRGRGLCQPRAHRQTAALCLHPHRQRWTNRQPG